MTWEAVADRLRRRGAAVAVPSLAVAGPPYAEPMAAAVAGSASRLGDDGSVVLAGHSGAGPLLPACGASVRAGGGRVAAYLFVDAALPHPGHSRLASVHPAFRARLAELVEGDTLPPWSEWFERGALDAQLPDDELRARFRAELGRVPVALLREPMPEVADWPDAPCGYLRLSRAYEGEEAEAARMGWAVRSLAGSHLEPIVDPDGVAGALVALARRLGVDL